MDIKMEIKDLFTKDTCLYKKNGRYKNRIKAYDLYAKRIITNKGIVVTKTFNDRINELNKNLMANLTCTDLLRIVCYNPKKKGYRNSFVEYYNKIAKMYNALDNLENRATFIVLPKGEVDE